MNGVTASDVRAALKSKYAAPAYAFISEVPNATGGGARRSADGLAMSLWPSRGMDIEGFEIKVARSDWLRELKQPSKAEEIARFCDRWWIVAPEGVLLPGELPFGWGYQVFEAGKLRVITEAPKLEAQPVNKGFVAAVLRRSLEQILPDAQIKAAVDAAWARGSESAKARAAERADKLQADLDALRLRVREYENASGVNITYADVKSVGAAVRQVLSGDKAIDNLRRTISGMRDTMVSEASRLEQVLSQLPTPHDTRAGL